MNVAKAFSFACFTLLVSAVPFSASAGEPLVDAYADAVQALLHDKFAGSNAGMETRTIELTRQKFLTLTGEPHEQAMCRNLGPIPRSPAVFGSNRV